VVVCAQDMTISGSRQFLDKPNGIEIRGILKPCMYETAWLKEDL